MFIKAVITDKSFNKRTIPVINPDSQPMCRPQQMGSTADPSRWGLHVG